MVAFSCAIASEGIAIIKRVNILFIQKGFVFVLKYLHERRFNGYANAETTGREGLEKVQSLPGVRK
jgi:hypothetical protein